MELGSVTLKINNQHTPWPLPKQECVKLPVGRIILDSERKEEGAGTHLRTHRRVFKMPQPLAPSQTPNGGAGRTVSSPLDSERKEEGAEARKVLSELRQKHEVPNTGAPPPVRSTVGLVLDGCFVVTSLRSRASQSKDLVSLVVDVAF
jgi:hypothetical protein